MQNVFTYGSLMFEAIWKNVVHGYYENINGTLHGYERKAVKNEEYPALVAGKSDSSVSGVVYRNVGLKDIQRLDEFEGEFYLRKTGEILLSGNEKIIAVFYVLNPLHAYIISDQDWNVEYFMTNGMKRFVDRYFGFRRISK